MNSLIKTIKPIFSLAILLIGLFYCAPQNLAAQSLKKDKLLIPILSANIGYSVPMGDLSKRYNTFGQVGSSFMLKFKNNILLSAEGMFLFGEGYQGEDPLGLIVNSNGTLTNQFGEPANYSRGMQGMHLQIKTGYIFSKYAHNPNSGITFTAGVGLFQSKYWISQRGNNVPQIMGEYVKGYDKLSNGLALTQFIGYTYFQNKNFWNAYIGIEFTEAWTEDRRDWDFTLMRKNNQSYMDISTSIKMGWIISFIRRESEEIYYY